MVFAGQILRSGAIDLVAIDVAEPGEERAEMVGDSGVNPLDALIVVDRACGVGDRGNRSAVS